MLVPKLSLGTHGLEAPASRRTAKHELARKGFPSRSLGTSIKPGAYARSQAQLGNAVREALLPNQEAGAVGRQPLTTLGFCNRA